MCVFLVTKIPPSYPAETYQIAVLHSRQLRYAGSFVKRLQNW